MPTYFITAATGHQGGAVAHQLLSQGHSVRAIVRNISSGPSQALAARGATLWQGSYYDPKLLAEALAGSDGVFLNPHIDPTDPAGQAGWARTVLAAAVAAGSVRHVVASTAFHTGRVAQWTAADPAFPMRPYFDTKAAVEQVVRDMAGDKPAYTWTILRPSWLMFDYLGQMGRAHFPELYTPAHELAVVYEPGARMPHFDEEDLGAFAVAAFNEPQRFAGAAIDLGYENLTADEAAAALTRAAGVEVTARRRSPAEAEGTARTVPTQGFHVLANWTDLSLPEGSLDKWGIKLTTFAEYLERNKDKLREGFEAS